jgi:hypothetical protein
MNRSIASRRRLAVFAATIVLIAFRMPAARSVIVSALIECADPTEYVVRFPCLVPDYRNCFSLDKLDPTCPQCL